MFYSNLSIFVVCIIFEAYRYHPYGKRPRSKSTETGQFKPIFGTGMPQGNVNPVIFAGHNTTQTFGYFNTGAPLTNFHTDYGWYKNETIYHQTNICCL